METQNSAPKNTCCNLDQYALDAGNTTIAMVFGFTGIIYLSCGDWTGGLMWLCLAASCALAIGVPNVWHENWKTPRALASIACCSLAIALLAFAPPHHHQSNTKTSAKSAAATSGAN